MRPGSIVNHSGFGERHECVEFPECETFDREKQSFSTNGGSIRRREHHLIVPVHVRLAHASIVARDKFAEESSVKDADCCLQLWSPPPLLTCTKVRSALWSKSDTR